MVRCSLRIRSMSPLSHASCRRNAFVHLYPVHTGRREFVSITVYCHEFNRCRDTWAHILHCRNLLLQSEYKNGISEHRIFRWVLANITTIQGVATPAHVSNGPVCGVAWPVAILSFVGKERAAGREGPKVVRQPASAGFCDVWRRPTPAREMSGSGRTCTDKSNGPVHLPSGVNGARPASFLLYSHHIPA
jgi:hypothetical protein